MILERVKGERYSRVLPLWKGRTVAILAGGPSLTAQAFEAVRLARETDALRSIAVNDSYLLAPWADLHYAADAKWHAWHREGVPKPALGLTAEDVRARWAAYGGERCSIEPAKDYPEPKESALEADERVHLLRNVHHPYRGAGLSRDPGFLVTGWNSGFQALNLAILAGAARVLLLGFDACHTPDGRSHWHGGHPKASSGDFGPFLRAFSAAEAAIAEAGVEVLNCSPVSRIESFPKVSLDEALAVLA